MLDGLCVQPVCISLCQCCWFCEPLVATSIHAETLRVQRDVAQTVGGVGVLVLAGHGKGECCSAGVAEVLAAS